MTNATTEQSQVTAPATTPMRLFVVWIDTNCGYGSPDWEANSPAKTYELAEQESADCLAHGFLSLILPEGQTPRSDGYFSNPATDPE